MRQSNNLGMWHFVNKGLSKPQADSEKSQRVFKMEEGKENTDRIEKYTEMAQNYEL